MDQTEWKSSHQTRRTGRIDSPTRGEQTTNRTPWLDDEEGIHEIESLWIEPWEDRRQELVIIGQNFEQNRIRAALGLCLLSDEELERGPVA